ncbi:hypothetical protein HK101_006862, partial [Irineochytrium annulatum]
MKISFKELLYKLQANTNTEAVKNTGAYALDPHHRGMSSMLFEAIKERLEETDVFARLALLFLLDHLSREGFKQQFTEYRDHLAEDMLWVVKRICPDASEASMANLIHLQKIINHWKVKHFFAKCQLSEAEDYLKNFAGVHVEKKVKYSNLSKADILRRIEEERDR